MTILTLLLQQNNVNFKNVNMKLFFPPVDESSDRFYHITICIDQANFPLANAISTGHDTLEKGARCYVRYKLYDKGK